MTGEQDLLRRLSEQRRDAFGATTAKTPPYPSRLASSIAYYARASTLLVVALIIVLVCSVR